MIYVFDTSSIRSLQHFYPSVFKSIWDGLDGLVQLEFPAPEASNTTPQTVTNG